MNTSGSAGRSGAVVTGIGLVTPVGNTLAEVFDALCTGRSGLQRPPDDHPVAGATEVAGIASPIDASTVLPPTEARNVDRYIVMAMVAAAAALTDADIAIGDDVDPYRVA